MFGVGSQEAQAGKLVNSGILEQTELGVGNTFAGHYLHIHHIHLEPLAGIGHLLVGLGFVGVFLSAWRE